MLPLKLLLLVGTVVGSVIRPRQSTCVLPDLYEASITELVNGLEAGCFTSVDLIKVSLTLIVDNVGQ